MIFKNSISRLALILGLLLLSLVSFNIYVWSIGLLFIILFLVIEKIQINRKATTESFILFVLLFLAALRFHLVLIGEVLSVYRDAFWGNFSGLLLCILVWLFIRSITLSNKRMFVVNTISPILWVHVVAFYAQLIYYLSSGKYLDFVEPVTGEQSRYESFYGATKFGIGSIRPTGLSVEPSTYFYVVLGLAILLILLGGFKKYRLLLILTIGSMYLSFSTAAVIIATLFVLYLFFSLRLRLRYYFSIAIIASGIIIFGKLSPLLDMYSSQQDKFQNSSGIRIDLIKLVLDRENSTQILAYGPFAIDKKITFSSTSDLGNHTIASVNDSGIFVFMWLEFGYLGILLFIALCYWQYTRGIENLILFLIFSLSKANPFIPFFIFYFAVALLNLQIQNKLIAGRKRRKFFLAQ